MRILQIGCGNMGSAFLKVYSDTYGDINVVDRGFESEKFKIARRLSDVESIDHFDLIILAIKPQDFDKISSEIGRYCGENTRVLSIMAMISCSVIAEKLGVGCDKVGRTMPSLGIEKNIGVSLVLIDGGDVVLKEFCKLFGLNGNILVDVNSDADIDRITPLTGSGSAYFLLLADILANFAIEKFQLTPDLSIAVVKNLLKSSLDLCENIDFNSSIAKIASKKGVTQAACDAMSDDFKNGVDSGMKAGETRAREFGKSN
jgi:pyrroline-5-carboxylate reductase